MSHKENDKLIDDIMDREVNQRIIKFRAWDKESKEMFRVVMIAGNTDNPEELLVSGRGGTIQGAILMQYTGLKDKNGKEIFEGDILAYEGFGGSVSKPNLKVMKFIRNGYEPSSTYLDYEKGILCYEIIGNTMENPELMEKKK